MVSKKSLFILMISIGCCKIFAQPNLSKPLRIAVLAPLYIDSAFDNFTYKLKPNYIPQYILGGLDFYNGVILAVDSLQKENINVDVYVYDTKNKNKPPNLLVNEMKSLNFSLIIASFNNSFEQKTFSDFSFSNHIPLISATYPNESGIKENPFFIMLNSTLKTHVEGIYKYTLENYSTNKILFVTKAGAMEDKIKNYFVLSAVKNKGLKYGQIILDENFLPENILPMLDSTKQNIILCGSLNLGFGVNLVQTISAAHSYRATVIGMPVWDGIRELNQSLCNNVQLVYSTPYRQYRNDSVGKRTDAAYKLKLFARPSDMAFKGFEDMYHFTHIVLHHDSDFLNHVSDKTFIISNNFNIAQVMLDPNSIFPDYLENKTLYFVKKLNGKIISVTQLD